MCQKEKREGRKVREKVEMKERQTIGNNDDGELTKGHI